jgi:hypothetical protein
MKFRTIRRLIYLKRARHRRGHGIHSPFLFRLITTVVESRQGLTEYKVLKNLKVKVVNLLSEFSDQTLLTVYHQYNLHLSNPRKLYRKVEMPHRYGNVVFRLIREFTPASVINYGPAFGANLALLAMANSDGIVYQISNDPVYELVCKKLLKDIGITNIQFFDEKSVSSINHEFIVINYPGHSALSQRLVQKELMMPGDNDVLIIRGIHETKEMELIWQEVIANENVRVSLDLFEIGIALFRKGLQKENFVFKY